MNENDGLAKFIVNFDKIKNCGEPMFILRRIATGRTLVHHSTTEPAWGNGSKSKPVHL
jgi:hypothetical protein